jgi:Kef-type K+ transport system membrane component KefB
MIRRVFTLVAMGILVWLLRRMTGAEASMSPGESTLMLGFTLLSAALIGEIVEHVRLPRITGYIVAGIAFGPFAVGFLDAGTLAAFGIFNDLAYAFIGLAAGAELRLVTLRGRLRTIGLLIVCTTTAVMLGVGASLFVAGSWWGLLGELTPLQVLAVASIVGVIAAARSPSSAIAIISETRARGPFSETILGVSVAMDVVVIVLFSVAVAVGGLAFAPEQGLDLLFMLGLTAEIGLSIVLGTGLGALMGLYLKHRGPQMPLVVAGLCFLVYRVSAIAGAYLEHEHGVSLHVEPLLICAAAGFVIQNVTAHGDRLERSMEHVSLPVYVVFFTLAGARLDLGALASTWVVAVAIAGCRLLMIVLGTRMATRLAGDPVLYRRNCWLGFITQAGLSLALIGQLASAPGDWAQRLATVLVSVVAINQLVGPAAFKLALERVGEVGRGERPGRKPGGGGA